MSGTATSDLTTTQATAVLNAVKGALQVVLTSTGRVEPGKTITAALVPAAPEIDASELANGALNLALTTKDVLYNNASVQSVPGSGDLGGSALAGSSGVASGQVFPPPIGTVGGAISSATNIPGLLTQLFGTVALPRLKVRLNVHWVLRKQIDPRDPSKGAVTLREGNDFVALSGLDSPNVSVIVPPTFTELTLKTLERPQVDRVCLTAQVTLQLGATTLPQFDVGPVEILLFPALIPTVVALFDEPNFGVTSEGTVLIVVPKHSPITSARQLFRRLRQIESALDGLRGTVGIAAWLLGIDELLDAIPEEPRLRFKAADEINKFGDIEVKPGPFFGLLPGKNFDDEAHSLIVLGVPGVKVHFFNDTNFKHLPGSDQGKYVITLNTTPFIAIRDMADGDSRIEPPLTMPPGSITDFEPDTTDDDHDWEDSLSSTKFDEDWLRLVAAESDVTVEDPPLGDCSQLRELPPIP